MLMGLLGIVEPSGNKTFFWFLSNIEVNSSRTAGLALFILLKTNIILSISWLLIFSLLRAFDNLVSLKMTLIAN